jgi:hypothetical protein
MGNISVWARRSGNSDGPWRKRRRKIRNKRRNFNEKIR